MKKKVYANIELTMNAVKSKAFFGLALATTSVMLIISSVLIFLPSKVQAAAARCIVAAEEVNCRNYMRDKGLTDANFPNGNGPQANKCYVFYASGIGAGFVEVSCNNFESQKSSVCLDGQTYDYILCSDKDPSIFPGGGPVKGKCYLVNARAVEQQCSQLEKLNNQADEADRTLNTGDCKGDPITPENCGILNIVVNVIRVLSGVFGVVVVIMIAFGGVQYAMARDNPQAVAAAKSKIINAILALVFYLMIFGLLQWLVPGGVI